jgi:hypothetical protein
MESVSFSFDFTNVVHKRKKEISIEIRKNDFFTSLPFIAFIAPSLILATTFRKIEPTQIINSY